MSKTNTRKLFEALRKKDKLKKVNEDEVSHEELEELISDEMGEQCYGFKWNGDTVTFSWEVGRDTDYEESWPYQPDEPSIDGCEISNYKVDGAIDDGMPTISISMKISVKDKEKIEDRVKKDDLKNKERSSVEIAEDPSTSPETLIELSSHKDEWVRYEVAKNPSTPPETLVKLLGDKHVLVSHTAAENPNVPLETLTNILQSSEKYEGGFLWGIAKNTNIPSDMLRELSSSSNRSIVMGVADNPNTPSDILSKLSTDESEWIRTSVASNPSTPIEIVKKLASDKEIRVAYNAEKALKKRANDK